MNKLEVKANTLFNKAEELKKYFGLEELAIKHFGNINWTGSSVTNLMADADIDSNVILKPLDKERIIAFAKDLTEIKEFRKVILYNRTYEPIPYFIINVERLTFLDESWTLTFFIEETDFQNAVELTNMLKTNVNANQRDLILQFKSFRIAHELKSEISSALLYEAVLDRTIDSIGGFKSFLLSKGIAVKNN
jgi:hypothetical protein